jgi:hypothetical protein
VNRRIKSAVLGLALFALTLVGFTQAAFADPRDFVLENDSYQTILSVYVSPASSDWWGLDVLGDNLLYGGYHTPIRFNANSGDACHYDIKVITMDFRPTYLWDVNLCDTYVVNFT